MSENFHGMATENAAGDDKALRGAAGYVIAPVLSAGVGAVVLWWRGAEMTLGHFLAIAAAAGVIAVGIWLRARRGNVK